MKIIIKEFKKIGEIDVIIAFAKWQGIDYEEVFPSTDPLKTSKGTAQISVELPDKSVVHGFSQMYSWFTTNGLMHC
jgi:hypothetical protein